MRKFYSWVVKNPKKILVFFLVLAICGGILQNLVEVNYDMTDYLPDGTHSTVLLLTTTSWAEPFVVLAGLGIAILINNGTNLIFGEISFVTNAAGSILQLAVSLDYSVFLIHRYEECLQQNSNRKTAMVDALCKSTSSIASSGLTTVIGFLALVFMRFGIGPDLGLALAKGVAISLITVFIFMPTLILLVYPLIEKRVIKNLCRNSKVLGNL